MSSDPDPGRTERQNALAYLRRQRDGHLNGSLGWNLLDNAARDLERGAHVPAPELPESEYRAEFHRLWGTAQTRSGYRKKDWLDLQRDLDRSQRPAQFRAAVTDARSLAREQGVPESDLARPRPSYNPT